MRYRFAQGRRAQLRLPLSPFKAEMALKALQDWRAPAEEAGERAWYRIANQAEAGVTQVNIFDEISWWGISAQQFVDQLAGVNGAIEVHINSPGGDAFDGITIYNALASRPDVTTVVDGLAASAASVIAMAGQTRVMSPGSMMMIHDALALCIGNAADMREVAGQLDKVSDNIASVYAAHAGKTAAQWRQAMVAEGWYTAQEAVDAGLAHRLAERPGSGPDPEASFSRQIFAGWHRAQAAYDPDGDGDDDSTPEGDTDHDYWNPDGTHKPMTVTHTHPHQDGDGGDHEHSHAHSGDADHGHSHAQARGRGGFRNADVDEGAWDGPAAMSRAAKADSPESAFRAICAGEKTTGEPDQEQHWALPHHSDPGDPPNRKGVSSALGYLDRTQDLKDKAAAQAHLEAHQKAMGDGSDDLSDTEILAIFARELDQLDAGKE